MSKKTSPYRANFDLRRGGLHKHLGIPLDQKIPEEKKQEAANSSNEHVRKMGQLALNFDKMRK